MGKDGIELVANKPSAENEPVTIKKYANRRLYNTATSSYVTLDHLCQMVKDGVDFVVYDAKTSEDITRAVLTQIIVEEEAKGENLLPIPFLRQLISFYGHGMQWMLPKYLETMMQSFAANQEQMTAAMQKSMGGMFGLDQLEQMSKKNMALLESTMRMFSPFTGQDEGGGNGGGHEGNHGDNGGKGPAAQSDQLDTLQKQVDMLQQRLTELTDKKK